MKLVPGAFATTKLKGIILSSGIEYEPIPDSVSLKGDKLYFTERYVNDDYHYVIVDTAAIVALEYER